MSYKLICLDVDGTLLNDEKRVPDPVKESLKKAHDMGIRIALQGRIFLWERNASTADACPMRQPGRLRKAFWQTGIFLCGFSRGEDGM